MNDRHTHERQRATAREFPEQARVTVVLARHGRTALNADGKLRGLADVELDEFGHTQVTALGKALADEFGTFAQVISSPLTRARQTAAAIADATHSPTLTDAAFNDRDYGQWTGHPKADVIAQWGSVDAAPGVETRDDVLARARPALEAMADRAAELGGPITVVSHDAVIRPLLTDMFELPDDALRVQTGSYQVLIRDGGDWELALVDQEPPV